MKTMMMVRGMFWKNSTYPRPTALREEMGEIRMITRMIPRISEKRADQRVSWILTQKAAGMS